MARKRLRQSRQLWGDYRRIRRSRLRRAVGNFGMAYFWLLLVIVPFQKDPTHLPVLVLSLYCTATVFGRSTSLQSELYGSGDLAFFMHVPVSDEWFWSYEWRKFLRSSVVVWALSFAIFAVRVFQSDLGRVAWLGAAAAATFEWLLVVGLVVVIGLAVPKWRVMKVGLPIYGLAVASVFLPPSWIAQLEAAVQILPTAWIPVVFNRALAGEASERWYLLVPILAFLFCLPVAVRRFQQAYPAGEIVYPLAQAGAVADEEEFSGIGSSPAGDGFRGVAPPLAKGPFPLQPVTLPSFVWNESGFIEQWVGRWLNARERSLAEFLCGGELGWWTGRWRLALKIALGGAVAIVVPAPFPSWIGVWAGVIACFVALPLFGGTWAGLQARPIGSIVTATYTTAPISYSETSRVLAKVNLIRFAVWMPAFFLLAGIASRLEQVSWADGLWLGAEILLAAISLQPVVIAGQFSQATNDTKRFSFHTVGGILGAIVLALIYFALVIVFFVVARWASAESRILPSAGAAIGMFLSSMSIWWWYRLFYDRGRIDLLRVGPR